MKQTLCIEVQGARHKWAFSFTGDPKYIDEWTEDGLVVSEVVNTIPVWAVRIGLARIWCRAQDAWRFLRV